MTKLAFSVLPWFAMLPWAQAMAEQKTGSKAETLESVEVVDVSPIQFGGIDINKIPANVQTASAQEMQEAQALSLADYMNRYYPRHFKFRHSLSPAR